MDPVAESQASPPGLLHKYHGRVLLVMAGRCPISCRYCFRRHFDYADHAMGAERLSKIIEYVSADSSIHEIILSGGEPLMRSDGCFESLVQALASTPHVRTLRFHTRMPVLIPERVTDALLDVLTQAPLNIVMVLHINHAHEIDVAVRELVVRREGPGSPVESVRVASGGQ